MDENASFRVTFGFVDSADEYWDTCGFGLGIPPACRVLLWLARIDGSDDLLYTDANYAFS